MSNSGILVTVVSSLISGLVGVFVASLFYARLERRKLKVDTARRLIGSRFDVHGQEFHQAINEVIVVFADSQIIMEKMERLWDVLESAPDDPRRNTADDKLISLIKTVCDEVGLSQKHLNDSFYLKFFTIPKRVG